MGACVTSRNGMKNIVISSIQQPKISINVIHKIKTMLAQNPLISFPLTKYKDNLSIAILSSTDIEKQIGNFTESLNFPKLSECMFKDLLLLSTNKLSSIFPDKFLLESCSYILFFFLYKKTPQIKQERKKFLYYLIKTCQDSTCTTEDSFLSGKLSFLILNLIIFLSYILLYFFISYAFLEIDEEFTIEKFKNLYIDKLPVKNISPKSFSQYTFNQIKKYNPYFSRENLCILSIQYIFKPLKGYFSNTNKKMININLQNEDIESLIDRIDYFFDPVNLLELMFTNKIKTY